MQQHYSQQHVSPQYQQQQHPRNVSSSPLQRQMPSQPFTPTQNMPKTQTEEFFQNYSNDLRDRSRQMNNTDGMVSRIQILEKENHILKKQLQDANHQIQILTQKLQQQPTQSLLKTTTFELVVLQKAVEQLEGLKNGLQKKKLLQVSNNQTTTVPDSHKEVMSEFKSKVTVLEEKQQVIDQQSSVQTMPIFPKDLPNIKEESKEDARQNRRMQVQSDQVDQKTKVSPMKYLNVKAGSSQNALRVSPRRKPN